MGKQDRHRKAKRQADWARKEAEIRQLVRDDQFEFTSHILDKITTDYWDFDDVVESLLNGSIEKAENDDLDEAVDGMKYTIVGHDCYGHVLATVGKIVQAEDGREYLVVTAY